MPNQKTADGSQSKLNISTATAVKTTPGFVHRIYVNTNPSVAGAVYDATAAAGATATNLVAVIPTTGGILTIKAPLANGLYINPGTSGVVAVSYD